jgi:phosphoribosylformylglycinamidine (FGAM) synthase-like enzyme
VPVVRDHGATLLALLAHPNIASKEAIIRRYDHEIGGATLVRPLVGVGADAPADGVVLAAPGDEHGNRDRDRGEPVVRDHGSVADGACSGSTRRSATSSQSAPTRMPSR